MAKFVRGEVSIHYEELGTGSPLLLLAPGGLSSTIAAWERAAINPLDSYSGDFRLIAMDQRNAGESTGPFEPDDPWGSYLRDQLALMDHLGIERFHVMGCCIGCSYALQLIEKAPERVISAVLEQPIGITEENAVTWRTNRRAWVANLCESRPELDPEVGEAFGAAMWEGAEFVVAVDRDFVRRCPAPLAVLPGVDAMHPHVAGQEVADLAPDVTLIDPWKSDPDTIRRATSRVRDFLVSQGA
jgi:pimeloyl-ACP methyl ester carboxylesterase